MALLIVGEAILIGGRERSFSGYSHGQKQRACLACKWNEAVMHVEGHSLLVFGVHHKREGGWPSLQRAHRRIGE